MIIVDPLLAILGIAVHTYIWVVFISVIISWLVTFEVINPYNKIVALVRDFTWRLTEPALRPIRRIVPYIGGIDISPVVLILGLYFLTMVIFNIRLALRGGGVF